MDKGSKVVFSKETMSNGVFRFFTVEHALMMIIAIVLITLGYRKAKKQTDLNKKHQAILWYYGIGLILIFVAIPWPFIYEKLGAGFF